MTGVAIVFLVNILTSAFKKWIYPRFGKLGVQITIFIFAVIGAFYYTYADAIPGLLHLVETACALFSLAVALYEVILSRFDFFKVPSANPGATQ